MNKRTGTALLFIGSFMILNALQSYYLYNSYLLEQKELNKKAKAITDNVLLQLEKYESDASEDSVIMSLKKLSKDQYFITGKISEKKEWYAFKNYYEKQVDSILSKETKNTGLKIALRSEIYSVFDELRHKELLPEHSPLVLFKTKAEVTDGFIANEGKWNSNFSERNTKLKVDEYFHSVIRSKTVAQLLNINQLILIKILPFISISIAIVILLTYLFWRTLKNLNLQSLKVAQLYTSIDSIAHELNTPLTTLKFTLAGTPDSETKQLLERQIHRLERLVSSIHNTSAESTLLTKNDLDDYIAELKKRFHHVDIHTTVEFDSNPRLTRYDFEQILNNLTENSVKYKSDKIEIVLRFNKAVFISVCDNGIGIPDDAQNYVFEKYYRVSRPENLQVNGLGVGLYVVKQIVEKYKGSVHLCSKQVKGVTFKISLPYA